MAKSDSKTGFFYTNRKYFLFLLIYITLFFVVASLILIARTSPAGEVTVPRVTGREFVQVYGMLVRKDLQPALSFIDAADVESGIVLRQYPEPGTVMSRESRIKLYISRNPQKVEIPSLVGDEFVIARNRLRSLSFGERRVNIDIGVVSYVPSETHLENVVISQSPKAGQRVRPDQKVNVLISMGSVSPNMTMPDVLSQHIDLAFDLLVAYGVDVSMEIANVDSLEQSGLIQDQNPGPGDEIARGDDVTLTVAFFERDRTYYDAYEKVSVVLPGDPEDGSARYEFWVDDDLNKRVRFSGIRSPGDEVSFVFYRKGNAYIEVLRDKKKERVLRINTD